MTIMAETSRGNSLRLIILVLGIGLVIAQIFVNLHDERTKKRERMELST
jgi:hypothetical protein